MRKFSLYFGLLAVIGLSGCEPVGDTGKAVALTPPEYLNCRDVPQQLAISDHKTKTMGAYDTYGAYWAKRSERLSARAYECKKARRR